MMEEDTLTAQLKACLDCEHIVVQGDGVHFEAVIVAASFSGLSRLQRHQRVYACLGDAIQSGEIHALTMKTLTPEEWSLVRS
jgi:acid stress-induced BolA-like protein IbaG/YrbA